MTQRLDDVTGDPIRLSARERDIQRAAMLTQINCIILQLNSVTAAVRELQSTRESHDAALATLTLQYQTWRTLPWRQRLRWLLLGP